MPRIQLKPNSPEFADQHPPADEKPCEMPGCTHTGEHKAPKNRGLNEYHWFCLDHIREYNKAWDFFSGMSHDEVQEHMFNSLYGDRQTWRFGVNGHTEDILRGKIWQEYNGTDKEPPKNGYGRNIPPNSPEFEALAIMGLEPPLSLEGIKERYKALAKKHHPDLNGGCTKSEELLKRINMAYTILKVAYTQFDELPERT